MVFTPPTLLVLSGTGFSLSDYSLRGLTATLAPIAQTAQVVRDVNANLLDLADQNFRKYRVTISCTDQETPGFAETDDIWPGSLVTVTLMPHLGAVTPLVLNMMVVSAWTESLNEYAQDNAWTLELEQI